MTPVCQLSDTTATYPFKRFLHKHQLGLRQEMKAKHEVDGTPVQLKCRHYEVFILVSDSLRDLDKLMDEPGVQRTLHDSISNGILAYRPDYKSGKLVPVTEQPWTKVLERMEKRKPVPVHVGNHRMEPRWNERRSALCQIRNRP